MLVQDKAILDEFVDVVAVASHAFISDDEGLLRHFLGDADIRVECLASMIIHALLQMIHDGTGIGHKVECLLRRETEAGGK
jgi:hypothetical protein